MMWPFIKDEDKWRYPRIADRRTADYREVEKQVAETWRQAFETITVAEVPMSEPMHPSAGNWLPHHDGTWTFSVPPAEGSKPTNPKTTLSIAKPPSSTVPQTVSAEVGVAMLEGAIKYGRHNYRTAGARASVYYDAARRHIDRWWEGEDVDPDSGLSHIVKAIASLYVLRDAMIQGVLNDDRPPKAPGDFFKNLEDRTKILLDKFKRDFPDIV